jgi:hypothetical protein
MASSGASGSLTAQWNGTSPVIAPAGSTVVFPVNEYSSAGMEITGTFVATVLIEATIDGITWFSPNCLNIDKSAGTASLTAPGRRLIQLVGVVALRARCSAYTSGTALVTLAGALAAV